MVTVLGYAATIAGLAASLLGNLWASVGSAIGGDVTMAAIHGAVAVASAAFVPAVRGRLVAAWRPVAVDLRLDAHARDCLTCAAVDDGELVVGEDGRCLTGRLIAAGIAVAPAPVVGAGEVC